MSLKLESFFNLPLAGVDSLKLLAVVTGLLLLSFSAKKTLPEKSSTKIFILHSFCRVRSSLVNETHDSQAQKNLCSYSTFLFTHIKQTNKIMK